MKSVRHPQSWEPPGGLPGRRCSGPWGPAASLRLLGPQDDWTVPGAGGGMGAPDTRGHSRGCQAWAPWTGFPSLLRGDFGSPWPMQLKPSGTFLTVVGKPQTCFQPFPAQQVSVDGACGRHGTLQSPPSEPPGRLTTDLSALLPGCKGSRRARSSPGPGGGHLLCSRQRPCLAPGLTDSLNLLRPRGFGSHHSDVDGRVYWFPSEADEKHPRGLQ